jgi:hypothetical protein
MHRHVGLVRAVHAQHAEPVLAAGRIGTEPHQRRGDRETGQFDQLAQQLARLRAGIDDAAAGIDDRPLGRAQQFHRLLDQILVARQTRLVAQRICAHVRPLIGAVGELHVLRDVDHDRAGTARRRDAERLVQDARQVVDVLDQPVVLGAGPRDADCIAFLEGVRADQRGRHLAGDADQRDRIHQRVLQRRDRIGRAGTGGHQHDARLAGGAGIALRRMAGALFVAHQDVLDILLLEDLVIDRKHRAARIAENVLHPVVLQAWMTISAPVISRCSPAFRFAFIFCSRLRRLFCLFGYVRPNDVFGGEVQ